MPNRKIEDLDSRLQPLCVSFLAACKEAGINVFVSCTYRSSEEQNELYAQGRTKPGSIVTRARGGQSKHNATDGAGKPASLAFDIAIQSNTKKGLEWDVNSSEWRTLANVAAKFKKSLEWGGDWKFKDYPHFQLRV
ncbi:M15 family metallopeptidase [Azospira sp. APE16]|uniref:M15 family metallopeptidase n=1 Tax=Azospira sp. APE16 TaxID=3394231 RepID=UPI003A4D9827